MQRRDFLKALVDGVAIAAAQRVWPFRVYSFPSAVRRPVLFLESTAHGLNHWRAYYKPTQLDGQPETSFTDLGWIKDVKINDYAVPFDEFIARQYACAFGVSPSELLRRLGKA